MGIAMAKGLNDKCIIVTGAGGGIGRESSRLFARAGARLLLTDIDEARGEQTLAAIAAANGDATFIRADLKSEAEIEQLVATALSRFGRLDGAFNNAAIEHSGKLIYEASDLGGNWDKGQRHSSRRY
jgi:NAD(P)-dependent dehydrogenase (short-subunit alcohol dehydrogenase family)